MPGTATAAAALALAGYAGASVVALKYPALVPWRKRRQASAFDTCQHISHRGGAGERLENTMGAFRNAVRCGTDMLEIDCQITRDGVVVVAHDDHLGRIAGLQRRIKDLDYQELPPIKESLLLDFDQTHAMQHNGDPATADRRIPRLTEVLDEFPHTLINIDVKTEDPKLLEQVSQLIERYGRTKTVAWGNFRKSVTEACYKRNPDIPLIFSMPRALTLVALFYTGLLPFCPIKESCLEIIMPSILIDHHHLLVGNPSWSTRLLLRTVDYLLMSRHLFGHLRARGVNVYCWVLNNEQEYARALDLGATGVMTDFPSKLRRFLDQRSAAASDRK